MLMLMIIILRCIENTYWTIIALGCCFIKVLIAYVSCFLYNKNISTDLRKESGNVIVSSRQPLVSYNYNIK